MIPRKSRDRCRPDISAHPQYHSRLCSHLVGQGRVGGSLELVLVLGDECRVDLDLGRGEGGSSNELERLVAGMSDMQIANGVALLDQLTRRAFGRATGTASRSCTRQSAESELANRPIHVGLGRDLEVLQVLWSSAASSRAH